jgi:C4-dicarboxylate-specific signal transduction histidine kinase
LPKVAFAIVRDISERKQLEQERLGLEERDQKLRTEESLHRMAGAVAHLFNNQLTGVIGFIELAQNHLDKQGEANQNLSQALSAAQKAAKISSSMLTYLGKTWNTKRTPMDLTTACQGCLPRLQARVPAEIELTMKGHPPGPGCPGQRPTLPDARQPGHQQP